MENNHNRYYKQVLPVLESKVAECHLLGYKTVTVHSLWNYLVKKRWKKPQETSLSQITNDIFRVSVGDLMNFESVEAFKQPNLFTELEPEELQSLLGKKVQK